MTRITGVIKKRQIKPCIRTGATIHGETWNQKVFSFFPASRCCKPWERSFESVIFWTVPTYTARVLENLVLMSLWQTSLPPARQFFPSGPSFATFFLSFDLDLDVALLCLPASPVVNILETRNANRTTLSRSILKKEWWVKQNMSSTHMSWIPSRLYSYGRRPTCEYIQETRCKPLSP